jgi:peptide/nickel transport system permease protein
MTELEYSSSLPEIKPSSGSPQPGGQQVSKVFWRAARGALAFAARRLGFGVLVLLFIIFLTYLGLDMAGGTELAPAFTGVVPKTGAYLVRLFAGDLGLTTAGSDTLLPVPVAEVIAERLPRSLGLLGIALLISALIGVFLGVSAARSRSGSSLGILFLTIIGVSIPSFLAAFLLQWGATTYTRVVGKSLLPVGGFGWDNHLILPVLVLAARPVAQITRLAFVSVREVLQQDYVRTARSKGLHHYRVVSTHVLRNAAIPILTTIGLSLRFSLSSLPVVELYFGWPGAGFTLLKGIAKQDSDLTIGLALCFGILFILTNLVLELSYRLIDPRLTGSAAHTERESRQPLKKRIQSVWLSVGDFLKENPLSRRLNRRKEATELLPYLTPSKADKRGPARLEDPDERRLAGMWKPVIRNIPLIVGGILVLGLLVMFLFGPNLAPNNPYQTIGLVTVDGVLSLPPFSPGETFPWGTDALGRDLMSLILVGAQQTLLLAILAVIARTLVGVLLGALAGWMEGGLLDRFILSAAEIIAAFPTLLLTMILILAIGIRQGLLPFILALCFVGWGEIMQFVRGEVISIRPEPFIESAAAVGARTPRIIGRHILPNLFSSLISIIALEMGAVLMVLGELGFINIFIGGGAIIELPSYTIHFSDVPEWGALLSNIRYLARSYPWTGIYPMLAFFLAIVSFNLFGEGFRRLVESGSLVINRVVNRYTVSLAILAFAGVQWLQFNSGTLPFYREQARAFQGEQALSYATDLTKPEMQGRALGTDGQRLAAQYIALMFDALGLQSAGEGGTYFQNRSHSYEQLDAIPAFMIQDNGPAPVYGQDFAAYPGRFITEGQFSGPVRFVALGEPSPAQGGGFRSRYPDLFRADFTGEALLALSDREAWTLATVPSSGMLVVTDDPSLLGRRFTYSGRSGEGRNMFTGVSSGEGETPSLWITEELADRLLAGSGSTVADLRELSSGLAIEEVYEMPLQRGVVMQVEGTLEPRMPVQHVIGFLPGTAGYEGCRDCLDKNLIVVMAQYDNPPLGPAGEVFPGATDNASGVGVMLEALRVLQETGYQPYKSFLFVAHTGEGLDGGELVFDPEVSRFLQARTGFGTNFEIEAVVQLRGVGGGSGDRLEVAAGGSLRLAELFETAAGQMGVDTVRADETVDISIIYDETFVSSEGSQEAPKVRLFWEGWEASSRLAADRLDTISAEKLEQAGQTLALSLMILGRETQY